MTFPEDRSERNQDNYLNIENYNKIVRRGDDISLFIPAIRGQWLQPPRLSHSVGSVP